MNCCNAHRAVTVQRPEHNGHATDSQRNVAIGTDVITADRLVTDHALTYAIGRQSIDGRGRYGLPLPTGEKVEGDMLQMLQLLLLLTLSSAKETAVI